MPRPQSDKHRGHGLRVSQGGMEVDEASPDTSPRVEYNHNVSDVKEIMTQRRRDTELDVSQKIYDKPGHRCEDCIVLQGEMSICSRNLNVSLSDLNTSKSVLEFLDKTKWRNCPYCLAPVPTETLPIHLILSHGDVYDIVGKIYSTIL